MKQVENIANPILIRITKQGLLHYKQKNPDAFTDICLYSEVSKTLSETYFRLTPRRLIQELFLEVKYDCLFKSSLHVLASERKPIINAPSNPLMRKKSYAHIANERRRVELTSKVVPQFKNVTKGFNIEPKVPRNLNIDIKKGTLDEFTDRYSPTKLEPRSPPITLDSVKEEPFQSSDDLLADADKNEANTKTEKELPATQPSVITPLESISFIYSENKFPIKHRESNSANVIK